MSMRPCPCGSGRPRYELHDARGIFCTFYCGVCEDEKKARYRPDVLDDPSYECDEQIEEED